MIALVAVRNSTVLGGWESTYIEMSLRAFALQESMLVLIAINLVIPLRAIDFLAYMYRNTKIDYNMRRTW